MTAYDRSSSREGQEPLLKLREVDRAKPSDGVPTRRSREALSATARVRAVRDVVVRMREMGRVELREQTLAVSGSRY